VQLVHLEGDGLEHVHRFTQLADLLLKRGDAAVRVTDEAVHLFQ
jgi:hypothetical protein